MVEGIISSFLCFVFLVLDHYFRIISGSTLGLSLVFKILASSCFLCLGLYSFFRCKDKSDEFKKVSLLILFGLINSLLADLFLELNFYAGFLLFVSAHILYFCAFSVYSKFSLKKWIFIAVFTSVFSVCDWFAPWFEFGILFPFVIIYTCVWTFVMAKAADSFKWNSIQAKLMPVGIILFGMSDILLQFNVFPAESLSKEAASVMFIISNSFYYGAQLVIAWAISQDYLKSKLRQ